MLFRGLKERNCGRVTNKNIAAFCKEMLGLRMVRKWRAEYVNFSILVDEGYAKSASVGQVGNHYFQSWVISPQDVLLTEKQILWLYEGLIFKNLLLLDISQIAIQSIT